MKEWPGPEIRGEISIRRGRFSHALCSWRGKRNLFRSPSWRWHPLGNHRQPGASPFILSISDVEAQNVSREM